MHRFDTAHECDVRTDGRTDGRLDDGKDARSILLSRVKNQLIFDKVINVGVLSYGLLAVWMEEFTLMRYRFVPVSLLLSLFFGQF